MVHRDLKPSNILLNKQREIFLADLGIAKVSRTEESLYNPKESTLAGTKHWMSPEMLNKKKGDTLSLPKSDIFSLGLIVLYCLSNENRFQEERKRFNSDRESLKTYLEKFRFKCPNKYFFYMVKAMLSYSPYTRPRINQILDDLPKIFSDEPREPLFEQEIIQIIKSGDFKLGLIVLYGPDYEAYGSERDSIRNQEFLQLHIKFS